MKKILTSLAFLVALLVAKTDAQIVITEIMYNPPEAGTDSLEYIELHNPTASSVDLEGWSFFGVDLTFAAGTVLPPGGYLLTAGRASAIQNVFGKTAIQWTSGALTNGGETIRIINQQGMVIDEVTYDDLAPWPTEAAGGGASLELCDVNSDNSKPENWKASPKNTGITINSRVVFASPGEVNAASCLPKADHQIAVQNFFFAPADITISQGEAVIWVCQNGTHNVDGSLATFPQNPSGFSSGAPTAAPWYFLHKFETPGVHQYQSTNFASQGMKGTVTVLPSNAPKIVITEIMYNDPGPDSLEYIEIYNNGTSAVDLSGWYFSQGVDYTFPQATNISVGEYLVVARNADYFESFFGFKPAHIFSGALSNSGENIEIRNKQGEVMDLVSYMPSAPFPTEVNGQGPSLVLCDPNADNNVGTNWYSASTPTGFSINGREVLANPGAESGCSSAIDAKDDVASVVAGQSINIDVLKNDFFPNVSLPKTVTISTAPKFGTASVNSDNTIRYTPNPNFCGKDELIYIVTAGSSTGTAKVTISVKCYPKYNIQDVVGIDANGVADSLGVSCEVSAVVYGVNLFPTGLRFTIIDATNNGLHVFKGFGNNGYTVKEGDRVVIRGVIDQFNGWTEIVVDTIWKTAENQSLVTPLTVVRPSEGTESKLIKINNLRLINPADWTTGQGSSGFTVRAVAPANPTDTVSIRIDNDVELYNEPAPTVSFHLTGIGGQNDLTPPYSSGYQIWPRYKADLNLIVSTAETDFSSNVQLMPNPTPNLLRLRTNLAFDRIQISAADGRILRYLNEPDLEEIIDFQSFTAGVYFLRFELDGKFWVTRVVKI